MTISIRPADGDEQERMDLEDVAVRHKRLVRLLQAEQEVDAEVKRITQQLQSAKRRLERIKTELREQSRLEVLRNDLLPE